VQFVPVSRADFAALVTGSGVPPEDAHALAHLFGKVLDGRNTGISNGVRDVLGREPRSFADFARDAAASGAWPQRRVS